MMRISISTMKLGLVVTGVGANDDAHIHRILLADKTTSLLIT